MDKLEVIKKPIEKELSEFKALFDASLKSSTPLLAEVLGYIKQRNGKMMRPILVLLMAKLYGGINDSTLHAALSLELLHTASLVHDDVVDESNKRRGQSSVNALYDNKVSVLVEAALTAANVNSAMHSLVIDGIFTGVGSVLSFLPIIVTLFFFLSLMEDSGYVARVAFVMDKLLRKIGLSGRSIVPMLIGFGCTVPAVMATRTLTSERDRKMTILLTPFMSCYLLGILVGILAAFLYNRTLFKGDPVPFVMELPNYRLPGARNVGQLLWEKAKDFLQRAFSIILLASMIIWFLQSFDLHLNLVKDSADSILAMVAGVLAPIFKPIGLGDWRICSAVISGFMAKESVVSTLEVLFSGNIASVLTPLAAASLLVFSLLYTPCVAAIASIKREMGSKWAVGVVVWQCGIAWVAALIVHLIGMI